MPQLPPNPSPALPAGGATPSILVVEDEFLIRMMLAESLADEGFQVLEASTAAEALGLLGQHASVQLMITDLSLPGGMDGTMLAGVVRQQRQEMPIIFVTGRPDIVDRATLRESDMVIGKPYLPSEIASAARRILAAEPRHALG